VALENSIHESLVFLRIRWGLPFVSFACRSLLENTRAAMTDPEEIIWNTITDSAKTRFDYAAFQYGLSQFDRDGIMAENILFMTIMGHAQERSVDSIVADVKGQLLGLGLGYKNDELEKFVAERLNDLQREIKAAGQALVFLEMGLKPPGILVQVRSILQK